MWRGEAVSNKTPLQDGQWVNSKGLCLSDCHEGSCSRSLQR